MSKKRRELTSDEKTLWRRVATSVKVRRPHKDGDEADTAAPPKPIGERITRQATADLARAAPPPQHRGNEKRVRRGKLAVDAKLDLHGHTQDTGRSALARFLRAAQARGARTVIVITGVGRNGEGILKRRLPEWLNERDIRPLVAGYAPAHRAHGGEGAFYVFIRRRTETPP